MDRDMRRPRGALAMQRHESQSDQGDRVHLVIPASSRFLRTARLVAADAAERAGCDVEEIEDFRIAVDELCHLLMTATDHDVHLTVTSFDTHVVAHGSARARTGAPCALDEVSEMIVTGTVDHYEITASLAALSFDVAKYARCATLPASLMEWPR
jgi:hypothetical protein